MTSMTGNNYCNRASNCNKNGTHSSIYCITLRTSNHASLFCVAQLVEEERNEKQPHL